MNRYYLVGITSSEGIDKNFNPRSTQTFYNNYKDKEAVIKIFGNADAEERGFDHIIHIYMDAFARNGYKYVRNGKKYYLNVFVLDMYTLQVCCFDIKTLIEHMKTGLDMVEESAKIYEDGVLRLGLRHIDRSNYFMRSANIIAKTKEFDTVFVIKAQMMTKPFFIITLEAINGVESFQFDFQNYNNYDDLLKAYIQLFNASFTLGFYTKEAMKVGTLTTSYLQALFLYMFSHGIDYVYSYRTGALDVLCYNDTPFDFLTDDNRILLARQSYSKLQFFDHNNFFVQQLIKQKPVEPLDIPTLEDIRKAGK